MDISKTAVLFTGKIRADALDILLEQTKPLPNKFASIWNNEDPNHLMKLVQYGFTLIYNDINQQSLYQAQFITIVNGLHYLKEKGFDYVVKTRLDIVSTDYPTYLELVTRLYSDKITVITGIETSSVYFLDIIVSGKINDMCSFFTLQRVTDNRYSEKFLIEQYSGKQNLTREEIQTLFHFSYKDCVLHSIEFRWYRPISWKSSLISFPDMRVISEYCNSPVMWH